MNRDPNETYRYKMKPGWQLFYRVLGAWMWFWAISSLLASLLLVLIFEWARKVIPAFRRMMAGEHQSYLCISERGLEYRCWPLYEIRCHWNDIADLRRGVWSGDILILQKAEVMGFLEFSTIIGPHQIPLGSLEGWSRGGLEAVLRGHAPHLFERAVRHG